MKIENVEETIAKIVNCGLNNVLTENDVIELLKEVDILRIAFDLLSEDCTNTYLEEEKQDIKEYYLWKAKKEKKL